VLFASCILGLSVPLLILGLPVSPLIPAFMSRFSFPADAVCIYILSSADCISFCRPYFCLPEPALCAVSPCLMRWRSIISSAPCGSGSGDAEGTGTGRRKEPMAVGL
jgi:hypothetical protein